MKPKITEEINGYSMEWPDLNLTIKANRINVHRDGRITGEITIRTDAKGYSPILLPATQINFVAERTRSTLIKSLAEKFPSFPWAEIIDQLAHHIQELARRGEPVQELWTHDDVQPPAYLLEPFIYRGLPNVVYGEKGVNKSTLALIFYTCLILPWYDNPLELTAPKRSIPTLYLDWETEGDIIQYYAKRLQVGMGLPTFPIQYRRCSLALKDDLEQILNHIKKMKAEAIIIDSLGAAAGGDLKTAEIALGFFTALRQLKVSSLIIAQTTKDEETKRKRIFGSHFFEYYTRNMWEIVKSKSVSREEYNIALFHRSPNLSAVLEPIGFHLHYNNTGLHIQRQAVSVSEFISNVSAKQKILDYLKNGAKTPSEIAEDLELSSENTRQTIKRLKDRDLIVKIDDKWGLKANV
jgi:hypothetical protein